MGGIGACWYELHGLVRHVDGVSMANPRAVLDTDPRTEADRIGYLRYEAPDGRIDIIMVTDGPSYERNPSGPDFGKCPVWHIDFIHPHKEMEMPGDCCQRIVVSPSIHIKDRYHTSGRTEFDLVKEL